ncbi:MAG: hypothetical protein GXP55_02070 [Deltaproteobacteria bacterium]|nr:hypothetical protein [Deltaproteobacteria bacterium]
MSLNTVLVLRADTQKLRTLFELPEAATDFASAGSRPELRVHLLEDGALVRTGYDFGMEPEALLTELRSKLSRALALHDDARGLFVYPSVAEVTGSTVDEVVKEIDAGGEWLALEGKREAASASVSELLAPPNLSVAKPAAPTSPSISELLGAGAGAGAMPDLSALLGGLGGPQGGLPDLGAIAAQIGLPDDAMAQVSAMLESEAGGALMQAAARMAEGLSSEDLSRLASGDIGAIAGKAEALASQMGLAPADDASDDDGDTDES